ncbi:ATP-binding protein [Halopenitus persicus]|uniref:histidine kinase n=1 Tax=Halopenitus persicus TaxID=1048396 RepID=A0A1H3NT23_9EURY|nr:ATP-binding protein [Halopenitus persicus]SDY92061.1 PAS domain S-box-containing protein [Halopenitus persicus]
MYQDFNIRWKAGTHLGLILLLFIGSLSAIWWFLQTPTHHGILLQAFLIGVFGGGLLIIILLFVAIDRHVVRPLEQMQAEVQSITRGDIDTSITVLDRNDEIGRLSYNLAEMKDQVVSTVKETKKFQQAVEQAGHAVYLTDSDGTIEYVNPAFEEITKYSEDEALGANPRILQSGHHPTTYYEELWDTILSGEVWEEDEFVNRRATGELFFADQTIAPITSKNDEITGFVGVMADRTGERVRDQQAQVLSRVLRHNLRTQLNLIDGYVKQLSQAEAAERSEYVQIIRDHIEEMESISIKAERTVRELQEEVYREPQVVSAAVERVCAKMEEKYPKAVITADLPEFEVNAPVTIESVLEELVENAIEHNDQDTPEVTIRVTQEEEETSQPLIHITVADNGPGIPEDEQAVIEQGEETPLLHGSGLGLWFVHWVVTLAGGEITISQRSPRGTRMNLKLPPESVSSFSRPLSAEEHTAPDPQRDNKTNT